MKNKTFIKVKAQFEGFHRWSRAPKEVSFLRTLHRHLFYIVAQVEVSHLNRQIEFFMFRSFLDKCIPEMKKELGTEKSCEMMANYLLKSIEQKYGSGIMIQVEVLEDNENGALVHNFDEILMP